MQQALERRSARREAIAPRAFTVADLLMTHLLSVIHVNAD